MRHQEVAGVELEQFPAVARTGSALAVPGVATDNRAAAIAARIGREDFDTTGLPPAGSGTIFLFEEPRTVAVSTNL